MRPRVNRWKVLAARALTGTMTATVLLSAAGAARAQTQHEKWRVNLNTAQEYAITGRMKEAVALYRDAAEAAPTTQKRAEILLELGVLYDRQASDLDGSATAFREAMDLATGKLRLQAANNLAAQLLRLDRAAEARDLMRGVWSEFRNTAVAGSRFLFNYARALEHVGQYEAAQEYYQRAYQFDPDFEPAQRAVARFALQSPSESIGIPELLGLTTGLLKRGDFDAASRYLKEGLTIDHWTHHQDYPRLVTQLAYQFTAARTTPEEYRKDWQQDLQILAQRIGPREAERLRDIEQAYMGFIPITFESGESRYRFRVWDEPGEHETLSAFLKMVGDHYFRMGDPDMALSRYSNAWALDTTNMEAGLYLANLLTAEADRIDPQGRHLQDFLVFAFAEKGRAYLGEDWSSILKFHTVLGTLFERMQVWGPDTIARTAAFQWKYALGAHARLAKEDPQTPRAVPAIRENLGRAYAAYGETSRAWEQYISAAEEYLKVGPGDSARRALEAADALGHTPDAQGQKRLETLEELLRGLLTETY